MRSARAAACPDEMARWITGRRRTAWAVARLPARAWSCATRRGGGTGVGRLRTCRACRMLSAATGGSTMRDFELDPQRHRRARPTPETAAPEAAPVRPLGPGRSPGLDAASLMHLQRTAGNAGVVQLLAGEEEASPIHEVVGTGGGTPPHEGTRSPMEAPLPPSFPH